MKKCRKAIKSQGWNARQTLHVFWNEFIETAVRTGISGHGPNLAQNSESVGRLLLPKQCYFCVKNNSSCVKNNPPSRPRNWKWKFVDFAPEYISGGYNQKHNSLCDRFFLRKSNKQRNFKFSPAAAGLNSESVGRGPWPLMLVRTANCEWIDY